MYYALLYYDYDSMMSLYGKTYTVSKIKPAIKIIRETMDVNKVNSFLYYDIDFNRLLEFSIQLMKKTKDYNMNNNIPIPIKHIVFYEESEQEYYNIHNIKYNIKDQYAYTFIFSESVLNNIPDAEKFEFYYEDRVYTYGISPYNRREFDYNNVLHYSKGILLILLCDSENFIESLKSIYNLYIYEDKVLIHIDQIDNNILNLLFYNFKFIILEISDLTILDNEIFFGSTINDINSISRELSNCYGIITKSLMTINLRLLIGKSNIISDIHYTNNIMYYKINEEVNEIISNEKNIEYILENRVMLLNVVNEIEGIKERLLCD